MDNYARINQKIPQSVIEKLQIPPEYLSLPIWNRLEGKPRGENFERALKAEVRDGLWMLSRQWQLGEFVGEDAGTPAFSNLEYQSIPLDNNDEFPMETEVERIPQFPSNETEGKNIKIRIQMANLWIKLMPSNYKDLIQVFIKKYSLNELSQIENDPDTDLYLKLFLNKSFDGYRFYEDENRFDFVPTSERISMNKLFMKFKGWYVRYLNQPLDQHSNWRESNLEYQYDKGCVVKDLHKKNSEKHVSIKEYPGGHLDWYNFELNDKVNGTAPINNKKIITHKYSNEGPFTKLLPTKLKFPGIPEARFWAIEDGGTNFAAIDVEKLDLAKLAVVEFALIYSNDWSIVPLKVEAGSFLSIDNLKVVDTFGKVTEIGPVNNNVNETWDKWSFFSLNHFDNKSDPNLFYPPSLIQVIESDPLEKVTFTKDEMANLVWAIEEICESPLGDGTDGRQSQTENRISKNGKPYYHKISNVPNNWIPFVAKPNNVDHIYRRGKLLDENNNGILPKTGILRYGLDSKDKVHKAYDILQCEVGREGVMIRKSYQRTRWYNGEVFTWLGYHKTVGRGEGESGLQFDQVVYK